jgi:FAD:protein FMN transferase
MSAKSGRVTRRHLLALTGAAALSSCVPIGAEASAAVQTIGGAAFGTYWRVTLPDDAVAETLRVEIMTLIEGLDLIFSPWRPDSALAQFNSGTKGRVEVPAELSAVAEKALALARDSNGMFDPTVGPLVAKWGFGPIKGGSAPQGWRNLSVDDDRLVRHGPAMTLDLCGIAKGYALDRIADLLEVAGCRQFLVDLGGELAGRGMHPSGRIWQVAVESPFPDAYEPIETVTLADRAIATSGDRFNGYEIGDRRYSHIIDPLAAEPVATRLASVSVMAPTGLEADGWATALMAAGSFGPELARRRCLDALFVFRAKDGLTKVATGAFDHHKV